MYLNTCTKQALSVLVLFQFASLFCFLLFVGHLVCVWHPLKKLEYFTIEFIFTTIHCPTTLFDTIHESYYTISAKFYFYLQYFQQKIFNLSKTNRSQTDHQSQFMCILMFGSVLGMCYQCLQLSVFCLNVINPLAKKKKKKLPVTSFTFKKNK